MCINYSYTIYKYFLLKLFSGPPIRRYKDGDFTTVKVTDEKNDEENEETNGMVAKEQRSESQVHCIRMTLYQCDTYQDGAQNVVWHKSCMGMQEECQDLSGSL